MKKILLTTIAASLLFSGQSLAAKVTYEDAVASSADFYNANNALNTPPSAQGLGPEEQPTTSPDNQMGKWVKLSYTKTANAGEYTSLLASSAVGQACLKGEKGIILDSERECIRWNSGGWQCQQYGQPTLTTNSGYKAECR
ncbi:hypothetical protein [Vibrio vulnificus]|uniref:hypothetical protein n=2 Tax=Vibrio vulnificus TaxID=672 RepID=UPI000506FFB9|nr:hypothetical protein [Vibrio vulnificus]EHY1015360.1 hypothetical protein [Vibrio vulnificus]EHY1123268.1 hypothetical protein [Vibrio vulnificus]KFK48655.1 hypothetical protein JS87_20605 [Vibrio vulnificus]KFK53070.1 hypothetical protein JS86_21690 [Vibrio vulnificus]KGK68183.1 hypothetical protein NA76_22610 [Vibrio vulnificus]